MTIGRKVPPRMKPVTAPPEPMALVAAVPMQSDRKPPRGCSTQMATVPEIRKVADLCHVFYNGSIIGTLENDQIDETTVMRYSTNSINAQQTSDRGGES